MKLCHSHASERDHMSEMDWDLEHPFHAVVVRTSLKKKGLFIT